MRKAFHMAADRCGKQDHGKNTANMHVSLIRLPRAQFLAPSILLWFATCAHAAKEEETLFGPKYVLNRFKDSNCNERATGQGSTQSWTRVVGATACYELTTGYLCPYRCIYKFGCDYDTGSGVIVRKEAELSCDSRTADVRPFAPQLYWPEVGSLFTGSCVRDGQGNYLQFSQPLESSQYPNCSLQGEVEPGTGSGPDQYIASYNLTFYEDMKCQIEYNVTTKKERTSSLLQFKKFRGGASCFDQVDLTPGGERADENKNWGFICGNLDMVGNGLLIQQFKNPKCTTLVDTLSWKNVYYSMNFPDTMRLLNGHCVRWGMFSAKFDRPWNETHYPHCQSYSCRDGPCTGGRIKDPNNTIGSQFGGSIRTSGADPAHPRSTSSAWKRTASFWLTALITMLLVRTFPRDGLMY